MRDGVLPSPGIICGDIIDAVFGNKTATTKPTLGHDGLEEQILETGEVLSQARFTHPFEIVSVALENRHDFESTILLQR